jgi:hypothetical protein
MLFKDHDIVGFCHKVSMFAEGGRPNNLEFVLFVEIMEVDWASDAKSFQDVRLRSRRKSSPRLPALEENVKLFSIRSRV